MSAYCRKCTHRHREREQYRCLDCECDWRPTTPPVQKTQRQRRRRSVKRWVAAT